jgi:hypothetical protein
MTIPTYNIGDAVLTKRGTTGTVTYYSAPEDGEEHGELEIEIVTPGDDTICEAGELEHYAIYHPDSEWYDKCGGGKEPVVVGEASDGTDT